MRRACSEADRNFRRAVIRRDKRRCKKCGEQPKAKYRELEVHHIKPWSVYPHLRREISNGITLCKRCHKEMKANEAGWEYACQLLIGQPKIVANISTLLHRMKEDEEKSEQV